MVLSVWSVVAVDEVVWAMISGSWRVKEGREGGGTREDVMKGRVMGEKREEGEEEGRRRKGGVERRREER